jgi:uncharacterized membrane protein YbaN (DUF454 family)
MNSAEAKRILLAYRPDSSDDSDPEIAEALEFTKRDPELRKWLEHQITFQTTIRDRFQELEIPLDLKERILASKVVSVSTPLWRRPQFLAAAAAIAFMLAWTAWLFRPSRQSEFADFRSRMVRTVLREYRMDIVTNSMDRVREFLATNNGHADYALTKNLAQLPAAGGGVLKWRGHPVSMVCFDLGKTELLYLFVIDRSAVSDGPTDQPQYAQVNQLATVGWTTRDKTYVLAAGEDLESLRRFQEP